MLKNENERHIIRKSIINIVLFIIIVMAAPVFCDEFSDEFEIKPAYIFINKAARDPFEPMYKKESGTAMANVDITTFSLQGITESRGLRAALFTSKSGSLFGYIFIDGKLYGENNMEISDINGEIRKNGEVMLIQGDREVIFRLNEDAEGQNIRPDTKSNGVNY